MFRFVLMIDITDWKWKDALFMAALPHLIFNREQWEYLLKQYEIGKVTFLSRTEKMKLKMKIEKQDKT